LNGALCRFWVIVLLACPAGCSGGSKGEADAGYDAGDYAAVDGADEGVADEGGDEGGDTQAEADWTIGLQSTGGETLSTALLGHYDLSGALFAYHQVPGLIEAMAEAGFSEWRVGVGRWEAATLLLPELSDGTPCQAPIPEAWAPAGSSDLDLIAARDWFTDDGQAVEMADTADDARYKLGYVRQVLDVAEAFGVEPFLNIDNMPRALAANRDPVRSLDDIADACSWTFTNRVSNSAPADATVFAAAVEGLVERIIQGSHGQPGRQVRYFEIWNEPEFCQFWDSIQDNQTPCAQDDIGDRLGRFFDMAVPVLVRLQAWRAATPGAEDLRFGMGSFAVAETAAATVEALDDAGIGLDFISFHGYSNDPMQVVARIRTVADALAASDTLKDTQMALAEWGPELGDLPDPWLMDQALHAATVLALGSAAGLDRAHRAIFWAFYPGIHFGLLEKDVTERSLHKAYRLMAQVITAGAHRLEPVSGAPGGELEGGLGALLAARDSNGKVRVLFVNRNGEPRTAQIVLDGEPAVPSLVRTFADPEGDIEDSQPGTQLIDIPARSLVLVELR